jgi:hypothetical protein
MTFADLYGTDLNTELGTEDTVRFTTVLRKRYVNEGMREFNAQTGCYVKRASIALTDDVSEYDIESAGVIAAADFLRPSMTTASLKRVGASDTVYSEGPDLRYVSEEALNAESPNWRAETAGVPDRWTLRADGGSFYVVLVPAPDVPATETWTLLWPYVAEPANMTDDAHEPFGNATPRTTLRPYHRAILHWAAAQSEKLRKNWDGVKRHLELFSTYVVRYRGDTSQRNGTRVRLAHDYRRGLRSHRAADPLRWP